MEVNSMSWKRTPIDRYDLFPKELQEDWGEIRGVIV